MHFYPEESTGPISELYHAERWHKLPLDLLTPMIIHPTTSEHFYVNEVALMSDGTYVVPFRWVIRQGQMCADAFALVEGDEVSTPLIFNPQLNCIVVRVNIRSMTPNGLTSMHQCCCTRILSSRRWSGFQQSLRRTLLHFPTLYAS